MDILDKRVRYFLTVVEKGSFSAAARELYLTQPALSKQIANLERETGVQLLNRSGYKPVLTPRGEIFYTECRRLEQDCREFLSQLREADSRPLAIGFTGSFENREIIGFINQFKTRENIAVTFLKGSFEQCLHDLVSGRVDVSFGIESTYRYTKGIRYDRLHSYEMCVITSLSHPFAQRDSVDVAEIKDEPLVCLSPEYGRGLYRDYMNAFAKDHITPRIVRKASTLDELIFSVSVDEGIAIISKNVVQESGAKIVDLKNSHHTSCYVVAYQETLQNPLASKFIKEVKSYFNSIM